MYYNDAADPEPASYNSASNYNTDYYGSDPEPAAYYNNDPQSNNIYDDSVQQQSSYVYDLSADPEPSGYDTGLANGVYDTSYYAAGDFYLIYKHRFL